MRDYDYINQESTPSSSDHARTRSNLPAPPHHWHVKHSNEHRRHVTDAHSAFEVRESRSWYLSSKDAPSTHSRKHHRPAR
ncbi:RNA-binding (RRM/RBD/RNP motifs) family protein [Zea mays]|nr:RNA-binding (RRM/RBD/RNP motifs) family protein [Zea mays]